MATQSRCLDASSPFNDDVIKKLTAAGNETLNQIEKTAVRLTKTSGNVNSETVKYLYMRDGQYYNFLGIESSSAGGLHAIFSR